MYAISVHQPWAWAILHAGKNVENRVWRTRHRGPLLIHASKTRASYDAQDQFTWAYRYGVAFPNWSTLTKRSIVGIVDVIDCVRGSSSLWAQADSWHWILANPRPFATPIPYRGAQLLFNVPDDLIPEEFRPRPAGEHPRIAAIQQTGSSL